MKILLINYEYPPVGGGAATATRELARQFVLLGHQPVVFTARWPGRETTGDPLIKVIEVRSPRRRRENANLCEMATFVLGATKDIRRVLRAEQIDGVVVFFSVPCGPIAWWGWRGTGVPYVVSLRGGDVPGNEPQVRWLQRLLQPLRRAVLRHAVAIVANSAGLKSAAERADPFDVKMIPNGVDPGFFHPPPRPPARDCFRFLFVGRFQAQKNLPWLLDQFAVFAAHPSRSVELHLVGDGPLRHELEAQAGRLGLSSRIHWHGWLDRPALRDRYQASHCLVNVSLYEGMPNVVLEGMACGLPVIASDIAGHQELVIPGETGWLIPPHSAPALLASLVEASESKLDGAASRRHVKSHFSWEATTQAYLALLAK